MSMMFGHMSNLALKHFYFGPMLSITFVPFVPWLKYAPTLNEAMGI